MSDSEILTGPVIHVGCVVCAGGGQEVLCSAAEVYAQEEYLYRFHYTRLKNQNGKLPSSAFIDRADFTQDYTTDIVSCAGCGLIFRNPRPSSTAIVRAYAKDYYGPERLSALFESQLRLYQSKARYLRRRLPAKQEVRVIEVGSFVGGFLAAGKAYRWDMLGVDPGREVNAFCQALGLRVFQGTLPEIKLEDASVDVIAIWNTFDQLPDPAPTLSVARRLLRPGGILVVRVPNGACFRRAVTWLRRCPHPLDNWLRAALAWNNLLAFPYLYGYSVKTLDHLLSRYSFTRFSLYPDTLPSLADKQTKTWAVREEYLLKLLIRLACRIETFRPGQDRTLAPWFDAYYRTPHEQSGMP